MHSGKFSLVERFIAAWQCMQP